MGTTRRESIRLILLGCLASGVTLGAVCYGRDLLKVISNRSYRYTTGLDFLSYEPEIRIDGEAVETVMRWRLNTRPGDITKWSTVMMSRMIAINPYMGRYAYMANLGSDLESDTPRPNLKTVISEANKTISALSLALDREVGERTLVVNPRLDEAAYHPVLWQAAAEKGVDPGRYFLTQSFDSAMAPYEEKENLAFEIDKPKGMSFDDYADYVQVVVSLRESYNSNFPFIVGINIEDAGGGSFEKYYKEIYSKMADVVLVNVQPDWTTLDYLLLDQNLVNIRKIIGSHKLYVRLPISTYDKKLERIVAVSKTKVENALMAIQKYADGHFVHDVYGMFLYRGIFGEDIIPPLDDGELKKMIRNFHRSHVLTSSG